MKRSFRLFRSFIFFAMVFGFAGPANSKAMEINPGPKVWKALFMTGDNSIPAFDNARKAAYKKWRKSGIISIKQLSMDDSQTSKRVRLSSEKNFDTALESLRVKAGEGCLVWLTSHGSEDGLYMAGQQTLTPEAVDKILSKRCGENPTVLIVSACHSGTFLSIEKPHRTIITAARKDRKSFGCSVKYEYTFFDHCILDYYSKSKTFDGLAIRANLCIKSREKKEGVAPPSLPQVTVGKEIKYLKIPTKSHRKKMRKSRRGKKLKQGPYS